MKLSSRQQYFSRAVAALINKAEDLGYKVTLGHAFRCAECPAGKSFSLHKQRLAIDLNLFLDGLFLTETEDHRELGEWWEETFRGFDAVWGGRFGDGNHYSFAYDGLK